MALLSEIKEHIKASGPCLMVLLIALVLTGGFIDCWSCVIGAAVSAVLMYLIIKNKTLKLRFNLTFCDVLTIALFYLLTSFYGVDGGESLIGFVRFLPVPLFAALLMQKDAYAKSVRSLLPYIAAGLGLISLPLMLIPSLGFSVDGRLGGFFQYPNTFAALLMVGELLLLAKPQKRIPDIFCALLLFGLIVLTQSRAVFVLTVLFSFVLLLISASKKGRIILLVAVIVLATAIVLLYPVLSKTEPFSRFLSLSVFESTFAGRLLYWRDALPLILKHPFGMGYLGYYFTEQSVQTGVYTGRFIHNDILQLILDVGWIPALLFAAAVLRKLFSKELKAGERLVLIALLLHICFDFDLQYAAMWFVLLILLDDQKGKSVTLRLPAPAITVAAAGLLTLFFAVALGLGHFGAHEASLSLYPLNTEEAVTVMTKTSDPDKMNLQAEEILHRNQFVQTAYSAKARYALSVGDVEGLMKYKKRVFEVAPFDYTEYEDYAVALIYCADLYRQSGDTQSAKACDDELLALRNQLTALPERLSYFGRIIQDQPKTAFPDSINDYIDAIGVGS